MPGLPVPLLGDAEVLIALGQAVDTQTAQRLTVAKRRRLGQAQELDRGFTVRRRKEHGLGQAEESDAAFAVTAIKPYVIGQVHEVDSAPSLIASFVVPPAEPLFSAEAIAGIELGEAVLDEISIHTPSGPGRAELGRSSIGIRNG